MIRENFGMSGKGVMSGDKVMDKWFALHGLFGDFSQWDFLENVDGIDHVSAVDLYPLLEMPKGDALNILHQRIIANSHDLISGHNINLVGYSMGGRIAMELFLKSPEAIDKLVILASHSGLSNNLEIQARKNWEDKLVEKLKQNSFQFIKDWNQQDIFNNDAPIELPHKPLSQLAGGIVNWGLSKQINLLPLLLPFKEKVFWLIGSEDEKYQKFAKEHLYDFNVFHIQGAGHRLLQHPEKISKAISGL